MRMMAGRGRYETVGGGMVAALLALAVPAAAEQRADVAGARGKAGEAGEDVGDEGVVEVDDRAQGVEGGFGESAFGACAGGGEIHSRRPGLRGARGLFDGSHGLQPERLAPD